jgi:hypothetical protein
MNTSISSTTAVTAVTAKDTQDPHDKHQTPVAVRISIIECIMIGILLLST